MNANEIHNHEIALSDNLTPRQSKMLEMLKDLYATASVEEIKSVNPILEKHGLSTMLSTIMKNMGIFQKERFVRWSYPSGPTGEIAAQLDRYYQLYPKIVQSKIEFQEYFDSTDPFPIPLNKIWQFLEFEQYHNAKRSLVNNCEEGKDFVRLINEAKSEENSQYDDSEGKFKLSRSGFQVFMLTAQKPMARVFARLMIEMMNQQHEFYLKVNSGVSHLSEKANLVGDMEESIRYLQRFHKTLSDQVRTMCCDPQQLLFSFEKDATRNALCNVLDEARAIATRIFSIPAHNDPKRQISLP